MQMLTKMTTYRKVDLKQQEGRIKGQTKGFYFNFTEFKVKSKKPRIQMFLQDPILPPNRIRLIIFPTLGRKWGGENDAFVY